jgi:hypothetical protein
MKGLKLLLSMGTPVKTGLFRGGILPSVQLEITTSAGTQMGRWTRPGALLGLSLVQQLVMCGKDVSLHVASMQHKPV